MGFLLRLHYEILGFDQIRKKDQDWVHLKKLNEFHNHNFELNS